MPRLTIGAVDRAIGDNIRTRRLLSGLSQETLGARIGITFQQIQRYETGVNRVAASTLLRVAEALDVAPTELLAQRPPLAGSSLSIPSDLAEAPPPPAVPKAAEGEVLALVRDYRAIGSAAFRRQVRGLARTFAQGGAPELVAAQ